MKFLIVFPLTIMLLASCTQVEKDQTHINLYIRYEADTQKILAEASFFGKGENGKPEQLTLTNSVAFLGSNMEKRELPGGKMRYQFENKTYLPSSLSLSWTSPSGNKNTVDFEALQIDQFQLVKENENYVLNFTGQPLGKEESLTLLFTDTNRNMVNKELKGPTPGLSVPISAKELEGLANGKGKLSLARTNIFTKTGKGHECAITYTYYSNAIEVEL